MGMRLLLIMCVFVSTMKSKGKSVSNATVIALPDGSNAQGTFSDTPGSSQVKNVVAQHTIRARFVISAGANPSQSKWHSAYPDMTSV